MTEQQRVSYPMSRQEARTYLRSKGWLGFEDFSFTKTEKGIVKHLILSMEHGTYTRAVIIDFIKRTRPDTNDGTGGTIDIALRELANENRLVRTLHKNYEIP